MSVNTGRYANPYQPFWSVGERVRVTDLGGADRLGTIERVYPLERQPGAVLPQWGYVVRLDGGGSFATGNHSQLTGPQEEGR